MHLAYFQIACWNAPGSTRLAKSLGQEVNTELVIFAILLFIVIVVWGLSSISQSLASAKQAQATIETARAAQEASTGNLVTILVTALVILGILAMIGFGLWLFFQVRIKPTLRRTGLPLGNCQKMSGWNNQPELTGQNPLD